MAKPNVIVFGASKAGENFLKNQDEYHVLAIADNDLSKQGKYLNGILIIHPNQIKDYDFEFIVIASMFIKGITKQLQEELFIHKKKIIYVPKRLLKIEDRETFADPETKKLAYYYLEVLSSYFNDHGYSYYLNFGTLLGIVRDGDLIPWDDDIDLAITKNFDEEEFLTKIKKICALSNVKVEFLVKRKPEFGIVGIDVLVQSDNTYPFTISVDLLIEDNDVYRLPIDVVPKKYFIEPEEVKLGALTLLAPSPVEEYLTHVYHDWKTVKKDVTFENNTTTYDEPQNLILQKEI